MTHIEDLVHFAPVGAALLFDGAEQRRNGKQIVFHNVHAVDKMQHFGLRAARAVHHSVDGGAQFVEQALDNRRIGACGRQNQFASVQRRAFDLVGEFQAAAVNQFVGHGSVVTLGVFLRQIFCKHVVAGACQSVAAHTAVVFLLVGGLTERCKAHNHVARADVGVVDDVGAAHTAGHSAVDNDGAHQVAHVRRLAARQHNVDTHVAHRLAELFGTVDNRRDNLARHQLFVAADGGAQQDMVQRTHT